MIRNTNLRAVWRSVNALDGRGPDKIGQGGRNGPVF